MIIDNSIEEPQLNKLSTIIHNHLITKFNFRRRLSRSNPLTDILINEKYLSCFNELKKENTKTLNEIMNSLLQTKKQYQLKNEIFTEISQKLKLIYKNKNLSITLFNNLLERSFRKIQAGSLIAADEILNQIQYNVDLVKSLSFYSTKSFQEFLGRNLRINKVQDERRRKMYYEFNVINDTIYQEGIFSEIDSLINGQDQLRRPIGSDFTHYGYLPIRCKNYCIMYYDHLLLNLENEFPDEYSSLGNHEKEELQLLFLKTCIFAHNDNEINYHPLKYRTEYCNIEKCNNVDCPFAHGTDDLELIFKTSLLQDVHSQIENLIQKQLKKKEEQRLKTKDPVVKKYREALDLIKTSPCPKMVFCSSFSSCRFYHSELERRRDPTLSPIVYNQPCEKVFLNGQWENPLLCSKGDRCEFFHTKNELFYDYRNYKRIYDCPKEKNNGKCLENDICPYKHLSDLAVDELYLPDEIKEDLKQLHLKSIENDKEIKRMKEMLEHVKCPGCLTYVAGPMIIHQCGFFTCENCQEKVKCQCDNVCEKSVLKLTSEKGNMVNNSLFCAIDKSELAISMEANFEENEDDSFEDKTVKSEYLDEANDMSGMFNKREMESIINIKAEYQDLNKI